MDARRFIPELVSEAQACGDGAEFRHRVLERLRRLIGFDSAIFLPIGPAAGPPVALEKDQRYVAMYLAQKHRYEPDLVKGYRAAIAGQGAYLDTSVYTAAERQNLPFFAEIIRPQGITSQIAAHVAFRSQVAKIHLCRHGRGAGYRERDRERLLPLLPIIGLAHAAFDRGLDGVEDDREFRGRYATLTAREREISRFVAYGYKNREIAAALGSSPNTVRNHLYQVFAKLGVAGRTELAVRIQRGGFAAPRDAARGD